MGFQEAGSSGTDHRLIKKCRTYDMSFLDEFGMDSEYAELDTEQDLRYALVDAALIVRIPQERPYTRRELDNRANAEWDRIKWNAKRAPDFGEMWLGRFRRKYELLTGRVLMMKSDRVDGIQSDQKNGQRQARQSMARLKGDLAKGVREDLARDDAAQTLMTIKNEPQACAEDRMTKGRIPGNDGVRPKVATKPACPSAKSTSKTANCSAKSHATDGKLLRNDAARPDRAMKQACASAKPIHRTPASQGIPSRHVESDIATDQTVAELAASTPERSQPCNIGVPVPPQHGISEQDTKGPIPPPPLQWRRVPSVPSRHTPEPITWAPITISLDLPRWLRKSAQVAAKSDITPAATSKDPAQVAVEPDLNTKQRPSNPAQMRAESVVVTPSRKPGKLMRTGHLPSVELLSSSPCSRADRKVKRERRDSAHARLDEVAVKQETTGHSEALLQETEAGELDKMILDDIDDIFDNVTLDTPPTPRQHKKPRPEDAAVSASVNVTAETKAPPMSADVENVTEDTSSENLVNLSASHGTRSSSNECVDCGLSARHTGKGNIVVSLCTHAAEKIRARKQGTVVEETKGDPESQEVFEPCHKTIGENVKQGGQKRRASIGPPTRTDPSKRSKRLRTSQQEVALPVESDDEPPMLRKRRAKGLTGADARSDSDAAPASISIYRTTKVAVSTTRDGFVIDTCIDVRTEVTAQVCDVIQIASRPEVSPKSCALEKRNV